MKYEEASMQIYLLLDQEDVICTSGLGETGDDTNDNFDIDEWTP